MKLSQRYSFLSVKSIRKQNKKLGIAQGDFVKNKREIGAKGEAQALNYLLEKGYQLIEQNYYTPFGEIDIIMAKENELYFIEVKYRNSIKYGYPIEAMTGNKLKCLKKSMAFYLKSELNKEFKVSHLSFLGILNGRDSEIEWIQDILI